MLSRLHPLLATSRPLLDGLLVVGLVSMAVGGLLALGENHLKRLLAYSTIAQYGSVVTMLGPPAAPAAPPAPQGATPMTGAAPRRPGRGAWPPRGAGHCSEDGRWWWDDDQGRWFRLTDQEDVLEIEAEDVGGISLAASVLSTLSSQYGNGCFRFVARANSTHPRWPTYAMAGATFPTTRGRRGLATGRPLASNADEYPSENLTT